jgi:2',3'-cyclic-nucleotide 2'-phosphodiesterase/3'-nucleotidase
MPEDTYTLQPANQGWAKLATLIKDLRAANPNTLVIDGGDATQGEPINYVWARLKNDAPEPDTAVMNLLGYTAMVVGNHEFDAGFARLRAMEEQAQFPWLAANVLFATTGKPVFTPYLKVETGGVSVAILGLTTGAMARLTDPASIDGLRFQDPVATARTLIPLLREKEKVDLVVVVLHGGLGKLPCGPDDENQALGLSQVPGIDLILAGHSHQQLVTERDGVPILQAGVNGQAVGVADFLLKKVKGRWQVESHQTRLVQVTNDTLPDPAVIQATAPLRALADGYLNTFATNLGIDLDGRWCCMEDTALMRLLHTVTRRATGAQITAATPPGSHVFIPRGPTSVRQFYALVPGEQHLARIQVTGAQLKAYLEHAARFFNLSHQPDLFNRSMAPADFDTLDGCTYVLDLTRPVGSRILDLKVAGKPVQDDQRLSLGLPAQRLAGEGGYLEAMGWVGKADLVTPESERNLLLDYVLSRPTLEPSAAEVWHTVPALDRERVLAQEP